MVSGPRAAAVSYDSGENRPERVYHPYVSVLYGLEEIEQRYGVERHPRAYEYARGIAEADAAGPLCVAKSSERYTGTRPQVHWVSQPARTAPR